MRPRASSGRRGSSGATGTERSEVGRSHGEVVVDKEVLQPASRVRALHRDARQQLVLHGCGKLPVAGTVSPTFENLRIEVIAQRPGAEVLIRYRAAVVAARRPEILSKVVEQVAVRYVLTLVSFHDRVIGAAPSAELPAMRDVGLIAE